VPRYKGISAMCVISPLPVQAEGADQVGIPRRDDQRSQPGKSKRSEFQPEFRRRFRHHSNSRQHAPDAVGTETDTPRSTIFTYIGR
jgi:hypothetical protein